MKIALVFPPFYLEPMYNMPPLGLINLATILKDTPHQVRIFDFPLSIRQHALRIGPGIYEDCVAAILETEPDLVCFSVQCTTYPPAIGIARLIKHQRPQARVVFGGHNASFVDELTLQRYPFIDTVVRGEGEITFAELVRELDGDSDLQRVDGITWRLGDRMVRNPDRALIDDLDSLPLSDYSFVPPPSVYRDACGIRRSIAILEVGRGCPHRCIYCSQSLFWRRRGRTYSIPRLIREMTSLTENFGAECFLLAYDQFTARRSFAEDFCKSVIDAGLNRIPWYCISRLDTVDEKLLRLMREAGCESMCYGIDSGSKNTLAFIRKEIDSEALLKRVRETTDQEIVPTLSFVTGFPEEQKDDLEATLQLALKSASAGNTNILVQLATILPGTDLHARYSSLLIREVDTYFSLGIEFDGGKRLARDEEMIESDPALFSSFYNLPCPAAPLGDLNALSSYFSIIAALYPRSFLLLALEFEIGVFELFFRFLDYLNERTGKRCITPKDCLDHFEDFAATLTRDGKSLVHGYLPELVKYETCLVNAGNCESPVSAFQIDLNHTTDLLLPTHTNFIIEQFTFNIPVIILEAKLGRFARFCPRERVNLIFRQLQGKADVMEINDFGVDFLKLSNGERTIDSIAETLCPKYGEGMNGPDFARSCADAARQLADLQLLAPGRLLDSETRGGETDAAG